MATRVGSEMCRLRGQFQAAADTLLDDCAAEGPAQHLLGQLGYLDGAAECQRHRAALLRAASGFRRIFMLEADDAPGLIALGAEVDPAAIGIKDAPIVGVSGVGLTFRQAFESCVGEGIEYLSQFATQDDHIIWLRPNDALADAAPQLHDLWERLRPFRRNPEDPLIAWATAKTIVDHHAVRLPAAICFRRPDALRDIDPPWPLSIGCGAGPDIDAATAHGLLELIERDAVSLWWRGGRPAHVVPSNIAVDALLSRLRAGTTHRRTWLLDITTDIAVPVIVAASCDDTGYGFCCGFAARATLAAAAAAAVREMVQMELAYRIADTKRTLRGEAALNETDRAHIQRFRALEVKSTPALHPVAPPLLPQDLPVKDQADIVAHLNDRLRTIGLAPCALDMTRPVFSVPATRTLCPGLEAGMTSPPGPRLQAMAARRDVDPTVAMPL